MTTQMKQTFEESTSNELNDLQLSRDLLYHLFEVKASHIIIEAIMIRCSSLSIFDKNALSNFHTCPFVPLLADHLLNNYSSFKLFLRVFLFAKTINAEHKEDAFDPNICYVLTINPTGQQKYAMEVERESNEGFNVLSLIVQESDLECLKQMIELGGKIEVPSNNGVYSVLPMAYKRFLTAMAEEEHLQGINVPFSVTNVQQRQHHEMFKFVLQNLADTLHNSGIHYLYSKWPNTRSALKSDFLGEMLIQCYGFQVLYDSAIVAMNAKHSKWMGITLSVLRYFKKVAIAKSDITSIAQSLFEPNKFDQLCFKIMSSGKLRLFKNIYTYMYMYIEYFKKNSY
ncbi:hypothetical protein RFI_31632 [Reticulomyxa filosa]|uniref:Uncharacterized protein n=1 Tax=Reticulomyxa filosa TaxID=46433 RepID=X6LVW4_RETFI|nr:hypothetical protein RFI_31632 [Reticulomyxa filosa]|eukprot:ETO05764.1 hypothetical protein RFI_31632 [Reticulomyxa filosa]